MPATLEQIIERDAELHIELQDEPPLDWSVFLKRALFVPNGNCDRFFAGKTVLITGAGGSIGSSLARMLRGSAKHLVLLDHSRRKLLALRDLLQRYHYSAGPDPDAPDTLDVACIEGNILDRALLEKTFSTYRPNIVFHAAALKHLAPLEWDPFAALETNVFGTAVVARAAGGWGTQQLVNVSTDKAVNPTSVLGVSKRIAELLLLAFRHSSCAAHSLRLGNVLGSSGSVVPIFLHALRRRLPLKVTQPQALRYFVTMEEAAGLLSQTLSIEHPSLLLPEMGSPKSIGDLADFLGGRKDAAPMMCIGLRDGEKHSEQLTYDFEYLRESVEPHIYEVCGNSVKSEDLAANLSRLKDAVTHRRSAEMMALLLAMVPEFTPSQTLLRYPC
jgi:FlaA1/EpsC-like NDP-sugar epimerase